MEDRETEEFVLVLEQYYSQLIGMELPVEWKDRDPEPIERGMLLYVRILYNQLMFIGIMSNMS